jgi:pyridoxamine 5'-phosphate oxidase
MSIKEVKNYKQTIRRDFANRPFSKSMSHDDPLQQYTTWFKEAIESEIVDPNAACLSTVNENGQPSSRIVYIKDIIEDGLVYYTNYNSQKSRNVLYNNNAALNLFWRELDRQIRVQGSVQKINEHLSDAYFASRPRPSQIGAWASAQSEGLENRKVLEQKIIFYLEKFAHKTIPRPPHWGGFCIKPDYFEFWQGRPSRLHDRIIYKRQGDLWEQVRLSP